MLSFEYGRALHVIIALFANNATACFDRMVPNISLLVSMKYGMRPSVLIARNKVMEGMTHSVQTMHGYSTHTQLPDDPRLSGKIQGKGDDVVSLWSALSHPMIRAHQELYSGITLENIYRKHTIHKNNDSFVDYTDTKAAKPGATFLESTHNTLLHASGGSIAFHKSHFQIFTWGDNECPLTLKQQTKFTISLHNINYGAQTKIKQLDSKHPNPGLGCLIAPSGQQDSKFMKKRVNLLPLASSVNRTYISPHYGWTLLHTLIISCIAYSCHRPLLYIITKWRGLLNVYRWCTAVTDRHHQPSDLLLLHQRRKQMSNPGTW